MIAVIDKPIDQQATSEKCPPRLENGDHLTAREFIRRYEAMPDVKKAELVAGIVYTASPIRADQHGDLIPSSRHGSELLPLEHPALRAPRTQPFD